MPLLLVQLRAQAPQVLRVLGALVTLPRQLLALPFLMVEAPAEALRVPLDVLVLRLRTRLAGGGVGGGRGGGPRRESGCDLPS